MPGSIITIALTEPKLKDAFRRKGKYEHKKGFNQ